MKSLEHTQCSTKDAIAFWSFPLPKDPWGPRLTLHSLMGLHSLSEKMYSIIDMRYQ